MPSSSYSFPLKSCCTNPQPNVYVSDRILTRFAMNGFALSIDPAALLEDRSLALPSTDRATDGVNPHCLFICV